MNKPGNAQKWRWTPFLTTVWVAALIVVLAVVILVVTGVVGSWALLVNSAIVMAVILLGYREERKPAKRSSHDYGE
jgi:MFS superfamily sulfate permease-like transporter